MRKWIVFTMFLVLFTDTMLGLKLGFGLGLSVKNLYLYVLCMLLVVDAAMKPGDVRLADLDVQAPFLILLGYAALTWGFQTVLDPAYDSFRGVVTMKNQLLDLYLFFVLFRFGPRSRGEFLWLLRLVVAVLALSSLITLLDYLNLPNLGIIGTFKGRVEGPVGAANQYGALLVFLIPIMVSLGLSSRGVRRVFWYVTIAASLLLLLATGSRGAYVALVLGFFAWAWYVRRYLNPRHLVKAGVLGLIVLSIAAAAVFFTSGEVFEEVTRKTAAGSIETASSGRWEIWTAFFGVMKEWPLSYIVGYGWNSYEQSGIWKQAHSVYIDVFYELGLIGLFSLLWLFGQLLARTRRHLVNALPQEKAIFIGYLYGLIALMIATLFVQIPEPSTILWMVSGLVVGLQRYSGPLGASDDTVSRELSRDVGPLPSAVLR
jgi:O-antigen ligase